MMSPASRFTLLFCTAFSLLLPFAPTTFISYGKAPPAQTIPAKNRAVVAFTDLTGRRYTTQQDAMRPAVYLFLSTECPITNHYTSRILALAQAFGPLGFHFFAVYPNPNESEADIRKHAIEWGLTCPVVRDDSQKLAAQFCITMTPEAVVIGRSGQVMYQGRIDDNPDTEQVKDRDLATALLAVYTNRPVAHSRMAPFGCPIRSLPPAVMTARETMTKAPVAPVSTAPRSLTGTVVARPRSEETPIPPTIATLSSATGTTAVAERGDTGLKSVQRPYTLPVSTTLDEAGTPDLPMSASNTSASPSTIPASATPAILTTPNVLTVAARPTPIKPMPHATKSILVTTSVTFARDVAPILFERCLPCHRAGEIAPFRMDTYKQAVAWASQIQDAVTTRRMPPWKADSHGEFHDEMRLSKREIAILTSWASGGTPLGRGIDLPPLPVFPKGWKLGEPDAVVSMPDAYNLPADGRDIYRCFVIPTHFSSDRWVSGIEYVPGNRGVVHHVSAFIDTTGKARQLDALDSGPGYTNPTPANGPGFTPVIGQLGGWVPGHMPRRLPEGVGIFLPKGADIVLEVHYHPSGKPEQDQSQFGLYFSRQVVTKRLRLGDVSNVNLRIPAGASDYVVEAYGFLPDDATLLSVSPHMHFLGKSMRVVATLPSGITQVLVDVPDWDFRWQPSYRFKRPLQLPARTRIDVVAHFDNSDKNPRNPNKPPKEIVYGEGTNDEMCSLFLAYTVDKEDLSDGNAVVVADRQ